MRVLLVLLLLTLAGCVSRQGPEPAAGSPTSTTTVAAPATASPEEFAGYEAWVNGMCVIYAVRTTQLPPFPLPWDRDIVDPDRPAIIQYTTALRGMFHSSLDLLTNLPPAPTDQTRDLTAAEVEGVREALAGGYERLPDTIATLPTEELEDAAGWASYSVHNWEPTDPSLRVLLDEDPVLAQAHDGAPNC